LVAPSPRLGGDRAWPEGRALALLKMLGSWYKVQPPKDRPMKKIALSTAAALALISTVNIAYAVTDDFALRLAKSSVGLQMVTQEFQNHFLTSVEKKIPTTPTEVSCYQILQSRIGELVHVGTFLVNVQNMAYVMTHVSNPAELADIKPLFVTATFIAKGVTDTSISTYQQVAQVSPCQDMLPTALNQKAIAALTDVRRTLDNSGD